MKFAVITPAYNEEHFIKYTLESVTQQTMKAACWIIVDDGFEKAHFSRLAQQHVDQAEGNNGFAAEGFRGGDKNILRHKN